MTTPMRDPRDVDSVVRAWLQEDEGPAPDRQRRIGRIMGRVDETKQRRRLWPLNPFGRRAMHSAAGTDDRPRAISPTTGMLGMLTPLRAMAAVVLLVLGGSLLLYVVDRAPAPLPRPGAPTAGERLDELVVLNRRAWSGEPDLLYETYAPDGVHTATFYDRTNEYTGPDEIRAVAGYSMQQIGQRIDILLTEDEWRWADFLSLGGGSTCLWHAVDGKIARHDCLVPENATEIRVPAEVTEDPDTLAAIGEIRERLARAWSSAATLEDLEAVYAPDAVHTARYLDGTTTYEGPDGILGVAREGGDARAGDVVDARDVVAFTPSGSALVAGDGEVAWASVADVGGKGVVCHFRARDGLVFRHDCLVPVRSEPRTIAEPLDG